MGGKVWARAAWPLLAVLVVVGCDAVEEVAPEARGQRGESCEARNDCESGLACINRVCSKNDFDITVSAKQCDIIDCQTTTDCCGDRPTEAPARCSARPEVCGQPTIPGCFGGSCDSDAECGGGTCGEGQCSNTFLTCTSDVGCADVCLGGTCQQSGLSCLDDTDCAGICDFRSCDCDNPAYDPFDPICDDPDCEDLCVLECEENRCVVDDSCESDVDCPFNRPICEAGGCVECQSDVDCEAGEGEVCMAGTCERPCQKNEECPLFHACTDGECVEAGCQSDRECVLALSGFDGGEDARLSQCLPSDTDPDRNVCKIPCENDGACGSDFSVCDQGFCKFIGCESDEDCRAFFGLENQTVSDVQPFVSTAVCRE